MFKIERSNAYRSLGKPENIGNRFIWLVSMVTACKAISWARESSGIVRSFGSTMKSSIRVVSRPPSQSLDTLSKPLWRSMSLRIYKLQLFMQKPLGKQQFYLQGDEASARKSRQQIVFQNQFIDGFLDEFGCCPQTIHYTWKIAMRAPKIWWFRADRGVFRELTISGIRLRESSTCRAGWIWAWDTFFGPLSPPKPHKA